MIRKNYQFIFASIVVFLILIISGCTDNAPTVAPGTADKSGNTQLNKASGENEKNAYQQTNLVSDISGFSAARIDPNLVNAWGLAVSPTGNFWISANGTGLSVVYDNMGNQTLPPVTIPTVNNAPGGTPSGVVYNFTQAFRIPKSNETSKFIFVGEDGIVSVWGPSTGAMAVVAADQSAQEAVYKGVDIAIHQGEPFLYATNFKQARIDVFDQNFKLVNNMSFKDNSIPAGFAPFNIKAIHNKIFVSYAKQQPPDNHDDQKGPGNGFVNIFTTGGRLITRLISHGPLNSPWGMTLAPDIFNKQSAKILIGNFGDGRINMFDIEGNFLGPLKDTKNNPISIDGLWAIYSVNEEGYMNQKIMTPILERIYFTAGPVGESHGLFGYLQNE
ncbi:MAG: TIGR03118 family protein [Clostridiales bacterium]